MHQNKSVARQNQSQPPGEIPPFNHITPPKHALAVNQLPIHAHAHAHAVNGKTVQEAACRPLGSGDFNSKSIL